MAVNGLGGGGGGGGGRGGGGGGGGGGAVRQSKIKNQPKNVMKLT